jgi:dihydrolipoamide dehydrogenase
VHYDVLVLGSGPAGYYCALNCARMGRRTVLVERDRLGGTGFRWGCLPVKMMLDRLRVGTGDSRGPRDIDAAAGKNAAATITETARRIQEIETRIETRLITAGVELVQGNGRFVDPTTFQVGSRSLSASRVVIATGTEPAGWPEIRLDGRNVISHREVLQLRNLPKQLLILGGDVEGIEFACLFARLGVRVTVIEKEARILPGTDPDLTRPIEQDLLRRGVILRTAAEVVETSGTTVSLREGSKLRGDRILVTGLRRPNLPDDLERAGVQHDEQKIGVDAAFRTSSNTVYAVGDINGITGMAHAAIQQAQLVAWRIAEPDRGRRGGSGPTGGVGDSACDTEAIPSGPPYPRAIYTIPEIAGAGYQEDELEATGTSYNRRTYRLADTWRGFSKGIKEGFIKILSGEDQRILGIWICGADASEQASLFGPLLAGGLTIDGLRSGLVLHPTLGEAALEAVLEPGQ